MARCAAGGRWRARVARSVLPRRHDGEASAAGDRSGPQCGGRIICASATHAERAGVRSKAADAAMEDGPRGSSSLEHGLRILRCFAAEAANLSRPHRRVDHTEVRGVGSRHRRHLCRMPPPAASPAAPPAAGAVPPHTSHIGPRSSCRSLKSSS